jgi:hypothetical protein
MTSEDWESGSYEDVEELVEGSYDAEFSRDGERFETLNPNAWEWSVLITEDEVNNVELCDELDEDGSTIRKLRYTTNDGRLNYVRARREE